MQKIKEKTTMNPLNQDEIKMYLKDNNVAYNKTRFSTVFGRYHSLFLCRSFSYIGKNLRPL